MPNNSAVFGLFMSTIWFVYFYMAKIANKWEGPFNFDSSELPIITIYLMYLPILIQWMRKEKKESVYHRIILPVLACCGSVFMVIACIFSHGLSCAWYLIVFVVIMAIGFVLNTQKKPKE